MNNLPTHCACAVDVAGARRIEREWNENVEIDLSNYVRGKKDRFTCLHCDQNFYVLSEGERREGVPCVQADTAITLADTLDADDGP